MAEIAAFPTDRPTAMTLGSVVARESERGIVWHIARDALRILPITRQPTRVPLSLENEVALHLPVSLGGWSISFDELVAWPRSACEVVGRLDERSLLKILEARKAARPFDRLVVANARTGSRPAA